MGLEISIGKGFVPQPDGTVWSYSQSASHVTLQKWTGAYPDGELASEADVTYERYAQFRREFPGLGLPELVPPGNTIGRVVGEVGTAAVPASQANPPVEPETEEEGGFWSGVLDGTQLVLDGVGLIPGVGEVADGVNALVSLGRGDYAGAALSTAAMIPFAGWGATGAKLGRKGMQAAEATAKAGKEAAEQAGKHADDAAAAGGKKGNDGGKVKRHGKCVLTPYRPDKCKAQGKIGHHVVPDRAFRLGSRKGAGRRPIPGGLSEAAGLVICLDKRQHTRVHHLYDGAETPIGLKGSPPGTTDLLELEVAGAASAAAVSGCNPTLLAGQLRTYHQGNGMGPDFKVRADKSGALAKGLSFGDVGSKGPGDF